MYVYVHCLFFKLCICNINLLIFSFQAFLQEKLTTTRYEGNLKFSSFLFLNMFQALTSTVMALMYLKIFRRQNLVTPERRTLTTCMLVALTATIASPLGYESLSHINFPTHMLAKSCKLIPVMFVGVLYHRRSFPLRKYVSVLVLTLGVSAFMLLAGEKKGDDVVNSNSVYEDLQ
jgi:UDP-galactose transporter B1